MQRQLRAAGAGACYCRPGSVLAEALAGTARRLAAGLVEEWIAYGGIECRGLGQARQADLHAVHLITACLQAGALAVLHVFGEPAAAAAF